ncbi:unnamed protein product [Candidula unifasciata]|uniref:G-protein coupled receptors family 1 profile domain-containing protein n=1 Tax=Candidula unifasciata TaxID=100452 RepID=A0A8S3YHE8_9EUPU|nr:unnamed protein product [Candidula unifasciata]
METVLIYTNFSSYNLTASFKDTAIVTTSRPDDGSDDPTYVSIRNLQKFIIPILCLIGLLGNLTSVSIFMSRSLKKKSCCMYLMTKCLTDTLFLAALFVVWLDRIEVHWFHRHGVCQMIIFITYICGFLSVWLVVMVTVENYIRIRHPYRVHSLCTPGKARVVLLVLGLTSIFCYNFPLWTTHSTLSENVSTCSLVPEYSRFNEGLTYFDTTVTLVLPSVLVFCFMCGIFGSLLTAYKRSKRMKRLGRQRHIHFFCLSPYGRVTAMLLAVSITFIALHTPSHTIRLRLLFAEFLDLRPTLYLHELRLQRMFELLYYSNFATNCVTYFIFGKAFRDLYLQFFCGCCCKKKDQFSNLHDSGYIQYVCESSNREHVIGGDAVETDIISSEAIMLQQS